jgi:hypothetical protein
MPAGLTPYHVTSNQIIRVPAAQSEAMNGEWPNGNSSTKGSFSIIATISHWYLIIDVSNKEYTLYFPRKWD